MIEGETNGYVLSLKIGYTVIDDTINGFLKPINKQVEMVCQQIAEDPQLQVRFTTVSRMSGKDLKILKLCSYFPQIIFVTYVLTLPKYRDFLQNIAKFRIYSQKNR